MMNGPQIPTVNSYAMPHPDDLPQNTASWSPDPARAALLIHDMQQFFLRGLPDTASPRGRLIANCAALRASARAAGVPVAYTAQPGAMTPAQRGLLHAIWGPGMSADAADRAIIAELSPAPEEKIFTKWRYSAFFSSELGEWLAANGRDQLIVCGVYAHIGILATTIDAFSRDIETFLPADAVADFSLADHTLALNYAARYCAVVLSTAKLAGALGGRTLASASPLRLDPVANTRPLTATAQPIHAADGTGS